MHQRVGRNPIPLFKVRMSPDAAHRVTAVLGSGYIGQGAQVEAFESALAAFIGHPSPLAVNSATSGLTLALRLACGPPSEPGEVLTPPLTCTATNWPILALGQRIRWVDTNPDDGNMDVDDLRRKLSPRTRAIMLVHWGGYPNDLDAIRTVQEECLARHGFRPPIIEDAAHAFGATYKGRTIGTFANYCVFSFQAIKHLTCGDGGALLCPDERQTERARLIRWFGIDRTTSESFRCNQDIAEWGYKFHMNDIAAAIGLANLPSVADTLARQRENAVYYSNALRGVAGIRLLREAPDRSSSCWLYTLRAERRDDLKRRLEENGIAAGMVHKRNDQYTCTREFVAGDLPGTTIMDEEMLCIPVGWWVGSEEREWIANVIREGW
jgi:dTDP-4-amino-4,6-dideoxy-D-glucose/dTDP-4-amino-2,4-dideoxy-beta-L-xylose transaminase